MQTYKYRMPAEGWLGDYSKIKEDFAAMLESKLTDGPDCLMAYCMFPTDSDILDKVDFDMDGDQVKAVNLYTYTELWDGCENDLKDCVAENLAAVNEEMGDEGNIGTAVTVNGDVEALGLQGEAPKTLYRISSAANARSIMEHGLEPRTGGNNYKNMEDYVYLCEEKDLAPWLAVLKQKDSPVILKVDTEGLAGLEPGRTFKDRNFAGFRGYGEYRTRELVPASAISEVNLKNDRVFATNLRSAMVIQMSRVEDRSELAEVATGMERLKDMGIMGEAEIKLMMDIHRELLDKAGNAAAADEEDEGLPWDEEAVDDFAKAVGEMEGTQMTLHDIGMEY